MTPIAGRTFDRKGKPYGNAVLTSLPVRQVRQLDLSIDGREPRGALDVDLDAYGTRLRVIATHLGLSPGERRHQVKRLLEAASHDDEGVTVLLGDINEWFVAGRPLRWLHARFGHGPSVRSWPAALPLFKLDRIWVHPNRDLIRFAAVRSGAARSASDHLPVIAEIEVSRPRHV
jgi:endonuclease/exonuclease/phosphatase family metal-dependent hydrolase